MYEGGQCRCSELNQNLVHYEDLAMKRDEKKYPDKPVKKKPKKKKAEGVSQLRNTIIEECAVMCDRTAKTILHDGPVIGDFGLLGRFQLNLPSPSDARKTQLSNMAKIIRGMKT